MGSPRAYSYLRFSTIEQMEGDSFRRQTTAAQDYAQKRGLELDDKLTFHDLGVSAFRGKNAEAGRLAEFLEAVRAGLVERGSFLLVENLDRISRQAARKALRVLEAICEEGITVVTLSDSREYTQEALDSDPMALIMSILTFIRANEESAMKAKRLKAAWVGKRAKAKAGEAITANGPWWLYLTEAGTWEFHKDRVKVLRWCIEQVRRGVAFSRIAKQLTEQGVLPPRKGRRWYTGSLRRILTSPALIGTLETNTVEYQGRKKTYRSQGDIPGYFPALLDAADYSALQLLLKPTRRTRGGMAGDGNLFRGLATCAHCGAPMRWVRRLTVPPGQKAKGQRQPDPTIYVCAAGRESSGICKWRSIHYDKIEEAFFREASHMLTHVPAGEESLDEPLESLRTALDETQEALGRTLRRLEKTDSDALLKRVEELERSKDELERELEALEEKQRLASGPLVSHRVNELKKLLQEDPVDRMAVNATLRQVFQDVIVDAEEGTVEFVWRQGGSRTLVVPKVRRGRPQKTG